MKEKLQLFTRTTNAFEKFQLFATANGFVSTSASIYSVGRICEFYESPVNVILHINGNACQNALNIRINVELPQSVLSNID